MATSSALPSYYQKSINTILSSILDVHGEILIDEEQRLIDRILQLENEAQRLFYRLFLRKPGWIQAKKLAYSDILSIESAMQMLCTACLCQRMYFTTH